MTSRTIALDADGVLLDYSAAYAGAWERFSGTKANLAKPNAYYPMDRWGVPRLEGLQLDGFRQHFDEAFWGSLPAIPGALDACQRLLSQGYELVCVTALDDRFTAPRARNLKNLGFPIDRVIATGSDASLRSPKADVINVLQPVAFVDDFAPYLKGVDTHIHRALVMRDPDGSPNFGEHLAFADSQHMDLLAFAAWYGLQDQRNVVTRLGR